MGTMINRRRACGGKKGLLPSGYTQVEYIESVGQTDRKLSPYINTGYKPNPKTFISVDFRTVQCNQLAMSTAIFGERIAWVDNMFWLACPVNDIANNAMYLNRNPNPQCRYYCNIIGNKTHFEYNAATGKYCWNDGMEDTSEQLLRTHTLDLFLFSFNNNGSPSSLVNGNIADIFCLTIKEDDIEVRNFIPCKNPNNVVGMYDTVNGVFYSSPNGTAFVAGPEV